MWQAATSSASDIFTGDPVAFFSNFGALGVVVGLMIFGYLVAKPSVTQIIADRDAWKAAWEKEQTAHEHTRDALQQAVRTSEVALESSTTVAKMLDSLQHPTKPRGSR